MNLFESFRIALGNLGANKLRSGLTMLGVIIGVGAVIALVSILLFALVHLLARLSMPWQYAATTGNNVSSTASGRAVSATGASGTKSHDEAKEAL